MKTKDRIIEATFLLSLEYGYNNVSIKQIKNKCNIAASSIYHHFENKDEILSYLVDKYIMSIIDYERDHTKDLDVSLMKKLEINFYYAIGIDLLNNKKPLIIEGNHINTKKYYLMFTGIYHQNPEYRNLFSEAIEDILNFFKELIEEGKDKKEIREDIDSEKMSLFIYSNMRGTIEIWLNSDYEPETLIDSNLELIEKILR